VRFAAHLPFYPPCNIQLLEEEKVVAPIRVFHGAADDWTPIAPCRAYVERVARGGADVKLVEFTGALHGFDVPTLPGSRHLPRVQNGSRCRIVERAPGVFVDADTGQPARAGASCVTLGATVGYNAQAHDAAVAAVKAFLRERFRLPGG
jgi:dienelactone hydrolase